MDKNSIESFISSNISLHYYSDNDADIKNFLHFVETWMLENNMLPNRISGKNGKLITFKRGKAKLENDNYESLTGNGLSILSLVEGNDPDFRKRDYYAAAYLQATQIQKQNSVVLSWDNKIASLDKEQIITLVKKLYVLCNPQYGYTYQRNYMKGPECYAWGTQSGLKDHIEADQIERKEIWRWNIIGRLGNPLYKPHMIRDVYPMNFLSRQHLDGPVGSQTLEQWILSDSARGAIEEVVPDFWCWSVPEENIDVVRQTLIPYDILIAHLDID